MNLKSITCALHIWLPSLTLNNHLSVHAPNNCPGVEASDIIAGGLAAFAAAATTGITFANQLPILGIGTAGTVVVGGAGMMVAQGTCPGPLYCRVGNVCCLVVSITGRIGCPDSF